MPVPKVSFYKVLKNAKNILSNPLPFHNKNFEKHGDIFEVNLGFGNSVIFTRDAGFAKHMLQNQHRKYYKSPLQTKDLGKYIGNGLLTSNGDHWLRQRRLIQPAFYKKKIDVIAKTIRETICEELSRIEPNVSMDIYPLMNDLAFKVVAKSLFSYTDTGNTMARLQHITEAAQKSLIREIRQPYKRWWFYLSGQIKSTLTLTQEARDILNTIIEERRRSEDTYDDLLDMLLSSKYEDGSSMDNERLIDEILILFVAGHETTSNALSFCLSLLALHPEIQESAYTEIAKYDGQELSLMEQFEKSKYVAQCIEESMRLYPPAYFSDRVNIEKDEFNDIELSKGTTVLISFFEIHRHKDFWENPTVFDPDRFHPDNKKKYSDWYFPFGAGPRMCVGSNFAMYEMIYAVSELIRKYKISTSISEIEIKPLITLKPVNAILKFTPRNK
ncbi:cytochrome P450 [Aquimarina sp. AD1]|uniref:cytochrome P450 n=1 Tax=Aquimarina sp. (strain AD1) TaxID=1714848 RepID=UPI000E50B267|nr:cytochrome P450 [Aquimarina sp. AD1]AXT57817.1 cytochrome P450 [Aquimarina sp. AD1]RKN35024.1 cytochrome P450 [Aquimarina sp. AD1]